MLGITNPLRVGNLMKTEEKHVLSYKNVIFMSSLAGLLGLLAIPSWSRLRDEDRVINAKRQAEVLGYQVFEIYRDASTPRAPESSSPRSPASAGTGLEVEDANAQSPEAEPVQFREAGSIGNDPWGQPYRYKILDNVGEQMRVQIWSAGPNRSFETKDDPGVAAETYRGDDVGVLLTLNQRPSE